MVATTQGKVTQGQIVAIDSGVRATVHRELTNLDKQLDKTPLLNGIIRKYTPAEDGGDPLPDESTLVQVKAEEALAEAQSMLTRLLDVAATKEWGNTQARSDVIVDGEVLIENAPAMYLVFLDKQLQELHQFVSGLPTLDPTETWTLDPKDGLYKTGNVQTARMAKLPKPFVKYHATPEHAAQVDTYFEDKVVGTWTTVRLSGALEPERVAQLIGKVRKFQTAVKYAQQRANMIEVEEKTFGKVVLDYIFG